MPTDQPGHLIVEEAPPATSPIENELPTYRAISNRAVVSVICGALAAFSYASLTFLIFAVLAVVLGVLAIRAIRRSPDVLTGTRLANAGIGMGLVFGLTVVTYSGIQTYIIRREASKFARELAVAFKQGSLGDVLLLHDMPDRRKDKTAADKEREFESLKAKDRMMMETKMGQMMSLRKALAPKEAEIHFLEIENQGVDESLAGGIFYFAAAVFEVEHPAPVKTPVPATSDHEFAAVVIKGQTRGRHYEWWVDDLRYPYTRKTYEVAPKAVDDGHGHGGGGHAH